MYDSFLAVTWSIFVNFHLQDAPSKPALTYVTGNRRVPGAGDTCATDCSTVYSSARKPTHACSSPRRREEVTRRNAAVEENERGDPSRGSRRDRKRAVTTRISFERRVRRTGERAPFRRFSVLLRHGLTECAHMLEVHPQEHLEGGGATPLHPPYNFQPLISGLGNLRLSSERCRNRLHRKLKPDGNGTSDGATTASCPPRELGRRDRLFLFKFHSFVYCLVFCCFVLVKNKKIS